MINAGWGWPLQARKAHYFEQDMNVSICKRWLFAGPREVEDGTRSKDDCTACVKKLPAT